MGDQDWTPVTVTKTAAQRNVGKSTAQAQSQVNTMRNFIVVKNCSPDKRSNDRFEWRLFVR
jgi:hypothetical protein